MKIKIIDLLNKIANNEEVPKKIKIRGTIYKFTEIFTKNLTFADRGSNINNAYENDFENYWLDCSRINEEVEIIEEEPKPITKESIEALGYACGEIRKCFENGWNKSLENKPLIEEPKKIEKLPKDITDNACATRDQRTIANKINELIDEINNLKEKQ